MNVEAPSIAGRTVRATVRTSDGRSDTITWRLPGDPDDSSVDALLAATLLPAMSRGETLRLPDATSRRLLGAVPKVQDVFVSWSRRAELVRAAPPAYYHVDVDAQARPFALPPLTDDVAAFFSGGVDSFYTAYKHRAELTTLVFIHGFDIPIEQIAQRELVADAIRRAATDLGLGLIEVETDVRRFSDTHVKWLDSHGAILASVALLLGPWCRRIYVPATQTYGSLTPLGSHPLVDPLWSTERVEIVHDGCEADRLDKLRALSDCAAAHKWLRVCVRNGSYNCGRCEKCIRTMTAIRVLGLDDRFGSFPETSDRRLRFRVATARMPENRTTWDACAAHARSAGRPALAQAIRTAYLVRQIRVPIWTALNPLRSRLRERRAARASRSSS